MSDMEQQCSTCKWWGEESARMERDIAALTRRVEEQDAELATLRQFRDNVVTVERASGGRHVVDIPVDAVVASYANLAAAIRARNAAKEG